MKIRCCPDIENTWKQGSLAPSVTVESILETLAFAPHGPSADGKVERIWRFTADNYACAIWDYKGVQWSTFGPRDVFERLFPGHVRDIAGRI